MSKKFFSPEWCSEALSAENAASAEIVKRFKNPEAFRHVLSLEVSDRPDLESHLRYEAGRCTNWTAERFPEDQVWARFSASLATWRAAAAGEAKASNLVMAGRMKLTKGQMKDALENAAPFDRLIQCLGAVDTDWDF